MSVDERSHRGAQLDKLLQLHCLEGTEQPPRSWVFVERTSNDNPELIEGMGASFDANILDQ